MKIGDTSEEAVNIIETTTEPVEETEPADNAENTEKLENKIMVSEIFIFTLAVENLQFNCDQCNKTNSSNKGLTQYMWRNEHPSNKFRNCHFGYCSEIYNTKYLKDKKKCKEGKIKFNMENVPEGHIIHGNQINTGNVNRKYHTTIL